MVDPELVNYYRLRAREYEQIYYREVPERRKEIDDEVERVRCLVAGKTVLELACGTGYWTRVMAETAKTIVASDISREMLLQAMQKEYSRPPHWVLSDLYYPPFRKESFDVVAVGFWFSHHPCQDYSRLFELVTYPLAKNGVIWMIDNNPPAEGPHTDSAGRDVFGNNLKRRFLSDGQEFVIVKNYFSQAELETILNRNFRITRFTFKKYYWSVALEPM
jgi:SAM-dependent methyltransferase